MLLNEFLAPQLSALTIDRFLVRSSILKEIKNILPELKGTLLDIGCGEMPYKELLLSEPSLVKRYIGIDIENPIYQQKRRPDLFWDGINMPLDDNSIDCAVATELFEHLPDLAGVLKEIKRVLKPGGILFFTIPFLWPLHDIPNDEYRYTPFSLERIFRKTGFTALNIKAMGGWNASLAQMIGLWLRRSPISEIQRKEFSEILFPLYKYLIEHDSLPSNFKESIMITGLTGTVKNNKCTNVLKLNNIEIPDETDDKKETGLAIFTPMAGAVSETFISNHINFLAPGRTIVFTSQIKNTFDTSITLIYLPEAFNQENLSEETKRDIIGLLSKHKITHILMEYGCEGRGIVKLNFLKMHLPIYIHFHGYDASLMLKNKTILDYYKWMGGVVNGIITVSNKMKSKLAATGILEEKMIVIPYGVNIHSLRSSIPAEPPVKLIAVSRLVAKKGIICLLTAFLKAKLLATDIILNIIGEGPLRPEIEEFISTNNLNNSVFLLGALPHEIVKKMMNDSHIFIQHSITDPVTGDAEGLPNTILEASAAGLPIISTFHEGIPDAVDHEKTGFLVKEFDVDKMAEYITSLSLNSSLREKMGDLGREKMTNDFHLKGQIQKLQMVMGLPKGEFSNKFDEPILENISTGPITPLISICIPTYNRTKYIGETIQHVLNQTYINYEIVIVDDGSTEDIKSIVNKFNNDKIRFISKEHTNAADTRNRCIDESRGEFILWQDDDDYPDSELLKEYVKTLNLIPDLDVIYSYHRVHEMEQNKTWPLKYDDWYFNRSRLTENLLFKTQFMSCGGLYRKSIYDKIGKFNTKFIRAHDYEMAFRIALNENLKLKLVPKLLYNYRQFEQGTLSGSLKNKDYRYEWVILNKVLSSEQFKEQYLNDNIGITQKAAFYFNLAVRYSKLNWVTGTIELLEKSIALKADDKAISLLAETRSLLTKLLLKRKEVLSFLKKDKNNPELKSHLESIDKFICPFDQNEFFPEYDDSAKGYSSAKFKTDYSEQLTFDYGLVSIIIPCYNQGQYLEECVSSVVNQSYKNWECLIINDGSPDNTSEIANALINKYSDKKIILYEKPNGGLSDTRNYGISRAKGKYILPLDADDLIYPTMLEASLKYLIYNNCDVVYTDQQYFETDNRVVHVPDFNSDLLLKQNYFAYSSLYKIAVWQKNNGYNKNMIWGYEDWDFWIGCHERKFIFGHLPEVLFKYRVKQNSMLGNALKHDLELKCRIILNHPDLYEPSSVETAKKLINKGPSLSEICKEIPVAKLIIVAIISAFNEGDTIYHVIGDLIKNGISIYLIDNSSTDNTYEQASKWLGKGLLHIEKFPDDCGYPARSKKEYVWGDILKRKEELAYQLNADWFIHADADEFRESPFPGTNLAEGIAIVDNWGYNAINFELFNFRPIDNSFKEGDDVRKYLKHFEHGQWFDRNQIKAWKKQPQRINLVSSGGHIVQFPECKIFPVPFILKHYPIRSDIQGKRKVFKDRLPRFSKEEKAIGWHVQYDTISKKEETFLYNADELTEYDEIKVKTALLIRALRRLILSQIPYSESINLGENSDQQRKYDLLIIQHIMDKHPEYIRGDHSIVFLDLLNKIKKEENLVLNTLYDSRQKERIVKKQKDYSISVIIPVFNKIQFTLICLDSISKAYNRENNFEIIIVDNASTDGTKEYLQFAEIIYPNLRVISNPVNIGFAKANNQGVKDAQGEYVIFLNNDTAVQNGWIDNLISIIENDNSVGAVGCKLLFPDGFIQHAGVVILEDKANAEAPLVANHVYYKGPASLPEANQLRTYQALTAACLMVRKSAFNSVDGFDEEYWNGYEDVDLCFKLRQDGWKLVYQPTSVVFHYESKSGPERFSKISQNSERLNNKWNHKIIPDFVVAKDGKISDAKTLQVKEYESPGKKEVKTKQSRTFDISIIVLTFNGLKYNKEFLTSIDKHTRGSYEVIIVDNASTDGTIDFLKEIQKKHDNYKLILNNENLGFPKAVNQAIKISRGKYYLIANNDIVVTKGWLERMVNVAESDPQIGIVGPISNSVSGVQLDKNAFYKNISELPAYAAKVRKQNANQLMEFPRVAFLCTLIKREVIEFIGGLDERFSPGNFEDDDFCLRAQLAGYKTIIAKDVFIHHYGSKSFTAQGMDKYAQRLKINEQIFINKWGANPDEIWIKGKESKKRNYIFPLNNNPAVEKYERALIYIEEKEFDLALVNLNEAIDNYSSNSEMDIRYDQLLNLSGNIAIVLGNPEAAKSTFEKELNFNPTSTSACKGLADIFFIKEEYETAKSMYEWAIKNDPDNLKAVNRLSEVNLLLGLNGSHNSLSATKQVSEFDNLFLEAYNLYESGHHKMAMGKVTEAVKHFIPIETMITKEDIYILIGNICLSLNELESSKSAFETALENNPQSSEACFGLGMIFYQSGQLNEAKTMFEWAIRNNPGNKPAINFLNELNVAIKESMEIPVENEN